MNTVQFLQHIQREAQRIETEAVCGHAFSATERHRLDQLERCEKIVTRLYEEIIRWQSDRLDQADAERRDLESDERAGLRTYL